MRPKLTNMNSETWEKYAWNKTASWKKALKTLQ